MPCGSASRRKSWQPLSMCSLIRASLTALAQMGQSTIFEDEWLDARDANYSGVTRRARPALSRKCPRLMTADDGLEHAILTLYKHPLSYLALPFVTLRGSPMCQRYCHAKYRDSSYNIHPNRHQETISNSKVPHQLLPPTASHVCDNKKRRPLQAREASRWAEAGCLVGC